jgi:hypothetical protein
VSRRLLLVLAALLPAGQLLVVLVLQVSLALLILQPFSPNILQQQQRLSEVLASLSDLEQQHRALGVALAGLALAWVGRRRDQAALSVFGLVLAWSQALAWLTRHGRPLAGMRFAYADVDLVLLLVLAGLTLFWLVRRRLTAARALRLLALGLLLALLNQTAFLDNPFSPLFGFAGIFFLVFGVVWNILTAGGSFINQGSRGLPRDSRLLLYVGYVLISVSTAHWYLASHNLEMQILQSDINQAGFLTLGLPLAYVVVVELGAPLLEGPPDDEA